MQVAQNLIALLGLETGRYMPMMNCSKITTILGSCYLLTMVSFFVLELIVLALDCLDTGIEPMSNSFAGGYHCLRDVEPM